jgi:hypothetical protein
VRAGGGGKAAVATKQSNNPVEAKTWPFICILSVSQTPEHFLTEVRDVAFCIKIL